MLSAVIMNAEILVLISSLFLYIIFFSRIVEEEVIMILRLGILFIYIVMISSCNTSRYKDPDKLKSEFDICPYWYDGMTWSEFLEVRNALARPGLVKYVDKIEQQEIAEEFGVATPKTYIKTREKTPIIDIITPLTSYVAKMTHLSWSGGLMIVKNGVDIVTGQAVTPQEVQDHLFKHLDEKPRSVESWALHHVPPGFIIQEYIPNRREVKIQTVWGKAVIGEWRGGEEQTSATPIWGRYDRDGNRRTGDAPLPPFWQEAIEAAEKIAAKTDALRVDFLVGPHDELLLNELEIWPESDWSSMKSELAKKLNDGYRGMCE